MLLYAIVFVSGGAILALELLTSRIMTPYFGVSLYIWTGILSITLVSLAIGYRAGGRLAAAPRYAAPGAARLLRLYALLPAVAALAIVAACMAYPHTFAALANWSLIPGAFAACLVLLFLPLLATSAMNPLLVAILLQRGRSATRGDAGAGRVFFVSTLGSVVGVLVTAFVLIPFVSNYAAALIVALTLAALALVAAIWAPAPIDGRRGIAATAMLAAGFAAVLLWQADAYTGRAGPFAYGGQTWRLEGHYGSIFGTVKVLRSEPDPRSGGFLRVYFQDGLVQNVLDSSHHSMSFYTYALEALARAYRPQMRAPLVLGLAAGVVPMRLAASGAAVHAVDIDPIAERIAHAHFGFDPTRVRTHVADARTYLRRCTDLHDVIVVDLFHGDGTPHHLVTREFFADLRRCLTQDGIAVFNTFADLSRPAAYAHFLATLTAALPHLALYRPRAAGEHVNSFVVASPAPLPAPGSVTVDPVPARHQEALWRMLAAPVPITGELLAGGRIVSDAVSVAAHDLADVQMSYRRSVVRQMPAAMLLN